ncbi:MAG: hypothetical protein LBE39_11825 [Flavobacteriaceae bacterium]|jgi:hypothetical protein|nr:hypothetical protein [Flavobacteriaceae bacterium]
MKLLLIQDIKKIFKASIFLLFFSCIREDSHINNPPKTVYLDFNFRGSYTNYTLVIYFDKLDVRDVYNLPIPSDGQVNDSYINRNSVNTFKVTYNGNEKKLYVLYFLKGPSDKGKKLQISAVLRSIDGKKTKTLKYEIQEALFGEKDIISISEPLSTANF